MSTRGKRLGIHVAAAAVLVALLAALYRPSFSHGLYSDDFALVLRSQKSSALDILAHDLLGNFLRDNQWPYWRPGWYLLFNAVHAVAGNTAWPYLAAGFLMHAAVMLAVYALLVVLSCAPVCAALGALLFATAPDYVEAVVWPAAAFNVLPCALLLLGSGAFLLRWFERSRVGDWLAALGLAALSLTFKEAAYHLVPLYLLGALALGKLRGDPTAAAKVALGVVPFAALAVLHYRFQNRVEAGGLGPKEQVAATLQNAAGYLRALVGIEAGDAALLMGAAAAALLAFAFSRPRERWFLVWTVAATFPYVVRAQASRFAYFFHVPLAVCVTLWARRLALRLALRLPPPLRVAPWALLVLLVGLGAVRTSRAFAEHAERGRICADAIASLRSLGLERFDTLCVDTVPPDLQNGLGDALELFVGKRFRVEAMLAQRQPPFLIYWNSGFEGLGEGAGYLRWRPEASRYELVSRQELIGGLVPVPVLAMRYDYRVFASDAELLAALAAREPDPSTCVLLRAEPGIAPGPPPARAAGLAARSDALRVYQFEVDTDAAGLLVICLPLDLTLVGARATLDGAPVTILKANGMFNAIAVPKGKHAIRVSAV